MSLALDEEVLVDEDEAASAQTCCSKALGSEGGCGGGPSVGADVDEEDEPAGCPVPAPPEEEEGSPPLPERLRSASRSNASCPAEVRVSRVIK